MFIKIFIINEQGQGLAEYALILTLVVLVVIVSLTSLGEDAIKGMYLLLETLYK